MDSSLWQRDDHVDPCQHSDDVLRHLEPQEALRRLLPPRSNVHHQPRGLLPAHLRVHVGHGPRVPLLCVVVHPLPDLSPR